MRKFRIIESFGLCGAGKTSILDALLLEVEDLDKGAQLLVSPPVKPDGRVAKMELARVLINALAADPIGVGRFLNSTHRSRSLFQKLGYRRACIRKRGAGRPMFLIDSGFIQPIVTFVIEDQSNDAALPLRAILSTFPQPDGVLYFRASPQYAMKLYLQRERTDPTRPVRANIRMPDFERRFETGYHLCERLRAHYRDAGVTVLDINAEATFTSAELRDTASAILSVAQPR